MIFQQFFGIKSLLLNLQTIVQKDESCSMRQSCSRWDFVHYPEVMMTNLLADQLCPNSLLTPLCWILRVIQGFAATFSDTFPFWAYLTFGIGLGPIHLLIVPELFIT
jgi:hypothetical protein